MIQFWLDSNTFIQAKNGPYGFDIAPGFWKVLDEQSDQGIIASSTLVYKELVEKSTDELAAWARQRKERPLRVQPDKAVQDAFAEIATYVAGRYPPTEAAKSLKGADLWVVAHAKAKGGRVVTLETLVNSQSQKAKMPNVCAHFGIKPAITSDMLRSLGIKFEIS